MDLSTRKWRVLLEDAADARYVGTGHVVFLRRGTLMAAPFDLNKLDFAGPPVSVVGSVMQALNTGSSGHDSSAGQFSTSASGSLIYASGGILPDRQNSLVWVDHKGKAEPITSVTAPYESARLSPDGAKIGYLTTGMERQISVYDLNRGTATKITSDGKAHMATWTPDGRKLVFSWWRAEPVNIYWQAVDGSAPMERLTTGENFQWASSLSPDGETLAFLENNPESGLDIMLLHMHDRKITPFLNSRFDERWPEFSPDGRWIAYASEESGRYEVYVQPFPGPGGKTQISNDGGNEPLWSRDGRQLFYKRSPNQRWVVDLQTSAGFSAGKPRLLFEQAGYRGSNPIRSWDISLDGQRFLMVKMEERKPQPVTEMILVQNWFEELKRLCPTGKK
jgi:WD40 repeat protein